MRFKSFWLLALLSVLVVLPADAKPSAKISKDLQTTLNAYAKAIRWNEFQLAAEMQDPKLVPDGFTEAQEAYYADFQVSGYRAKYSQWQDETHYSQRVEILLIDTDTQTQRTVTDRQTWQYDPEAKRWWLTSGLPRLD